MKLDGGELSIRKVRAVSVGWLEKEATQSGRGLLDMLSLDHMTIYFDSHQQGPTACVIHRDGRAIHLTAPVIFVCWKAESPSEAIVQVSQVMELVRPQQPQPFIHPLHPTLQ